MQNEQKPIVSVARNEDITQAVNLTLDQINIPDLTGKTVLLKPNVGREVDPRTSVNTNPDVVKAVFNYLKKRFKAKFLIGDSPIINTDTFKAFNQSGFSDLIKDPQIQFIDLDSKPPIEADIPNGKILKNIKLTGYLNEIDFIISIPVLKMHMHTGASLSFKNLKGLIYKRNKISLHHLQAPDIIKKLQTSMKLVKELDVAISDLAQVIKPDLAVIDASCAQEGMGPSSGNAVKLNTIIASMNKKLFYILASISICVIALSIAYYLVVFIPQREKFKQSTQQETYERNVLEEQSDETKYAQCNTEASKYAHDFLKTKIELMEEQGYTNMEQYKLWKNAYDKNLYLKDDYNTAYENCIRKSRCFI